MRSVTRRTFLGGAAVAAGAAFAPRPAAQNAPVPIIDTHIHLFDPTRPQGARPALWKNHRDKRTRLAGAA